MRTSMQAAIPTAAQRKTSASLLSPIGRKHLTPPYEYDPNRWKFLLHQAVVTMVPCYFSECFFRWCFNQHFCHSHTRKLSCTLRHWSRVYLCFITSPWSCGVLKRIWWVMYQTLFCLGMMSSQNGDRNGSSYVRLKVRRCASPEATPSAVAILAAGLLRADWVCVLACMW